MAEISADADKKARSSPKFVLGTEDENVLLEKKEFDSRHEALKFVSNDTPKNEKNIEPTGKTQSAETHSVKAEFSEQPRNEFLEEKAKEIFNKEDASSLEFEENDSLRSASSFSQERSSQQRASITPLNNNNFSRNAEAIAGSMSSDLDRRESFQQLAPKGSEMYVNSCDKQNIQDSAAFVPVSRKRPEELVLASATIKNDSRALDGSVSGSNAAAEVSLDKQQNVKKYLIFRKQTASINTDSPLVNAIEKNFQQFMAAEAPSKATAKSILETATPIVVEWSDADTAERSSTMKPLFSLGTIPTSPKPFPDSANENGRNSTTPHRLSSNEATDKESSRLESLRSALQSDGPSFENRAIERPVYSVESNREDRDIFLEGSPSSSIASLSSAAAGSSGLLSSGSTLRELQPFLASFSSEEIPLNSNHLVTSKAEGQRHLHQREATRLHETTSPRESSLLRENCRLHEVSPPREVNPPPESGLPREAGPPRENGLPRELTLPYGAALSRESTLPRGSPPTWPVSYDLEGLQHVILKKDSGNVDEGGRTDQDQMEAIAHTVAPNFIQDTGKKLSDTNSDWNDAVVEVISSIPNILEENASGRLESSSASRVPPSTSPTSLTASNIPAKAVATSTPKTKLTHSHTSRRRASSLVPYSFSGLSKWVQSSLSNAPNDKLFEKTTLKDEGSAVPRLSISLSADADSTGATPLLPAPFNATKVEASGLLANTPDPRQTASPKSTESPELQENQTSENQQESHYSRATSVLSSQELLGRTNSDMLDGKRSSRTLGNKKNAERKRQKSRVRRESKSSTLKPQNSTTGALDAVSAWGSYITSLNPFQNEEQSPPTQLEAQDLTKSRKSNGSPKQPSSGTATWLDYLDNVQRTVAEQGKIIGERILYRLATARGMFSSDYDTPNDIRVKPKKKRLLSE